MPTSVLICDDSAFARKQIARALPQWWDVALEFAGDGAEALSLIRSKRIEVLFLDLTMPGLDGYGVLEALRAEEISCQVVVVSGDVQPQARQRVLELGAREFLKKPVAADELAEALERLQIAHRAPVAAASPRREPSVQPDLLDGCREVVNVAMGQAGDLLARTLGVFVILPVPNVNMLEASELRMLLGAAEGEGGGLAVCQGFIGSGIAGEAMLVFNNASFESLARLTDYQGELDETVEIELLMDVGNLLIGACLKGIATQLDIIFSQAHPSVLGRHHKIGDLLAANGERWRKTLAIEIGYAIEDYAINCDLLLLFTEDSVPALNEKIGHLLDE